MKFTYSDSAAGLQKETFVLLSDIIKYIEDFKPRGESAGVVFQNGEPILEYLSTDDGIKWIAA